MIIEWIMEVSAGFLEWLGTLMPVWELPEWAENPFGWVESILQVIQGANYWVALPVASVVAGVIIATYGVMFGIKLVLRLVSHVPFFGGRG